MYLHDIFGNKSKMHFACGIVKEAIDQNPFWVFNRDARAN